MVCFARRLGSRAVHGERGAQAVRRRPSRSRAGRQARAASNALRALATCVYTTSRGAVRRAAAAAAGTATESCRGNTSAAAAWWFADADNSASPHVVHGYGNCAARVARAACWARRRVVEIARSGFVTVSRTTTTYRTTYRLTASARSRMISVGTCL